MEENDIIEEEFQSDSDEYPLHDLLDFLIENNLDDAEELFLSCSIEIQKELITDSFNIDIPGLGYHHNCTLLHMAAYFGSDKLVSALIKLGADIETTNNYSYKAIHFAAASPRAGSLAIMKVLIELSFVWNCQTSDNNNSYPLHLAVGNLEKIKLLVSNNADVNCKNDRGITPLHIAVRYCAVDPNTSIEVAKYLIEKGAADSLNAKATFNPSEVPITPLTTALMLGFSGMANFLFTETKRLFPQNPDVIVYFGNCQSFSGAKLFWTLQDSNVEYMNTVFSIASETLDIYLVETLHNAQRSWFSKFSSEFSATFTGNAHSVTRIKQRFNEVTAALQALQSTNNLREVLNRCQANARCITEILNEVSQIIPRLSQ